ncbi:MAG: FtsX-like permease family protein [Trebonia sp.]
MTKARPTTREFGTLETMGWSSRRIIAQVLGESLATGIAAAAAGVGLGFASAAIIGRAVQSVTPGTIALAVVLALLGGLLADAFASWRIARLRPAALVRVTWHPKKHFIPNDTGSSPSASDLGQPGRPGVRGHDDRPRARLRRRLDRGGRNIRRRTPAQDHRVIRLIRARLTRRGHNTLVVPVSRPVGQELSHTIAAFPAKRLHLLRYLPHVRLDRLQRGVERGRKVTDQE